MSAVLITLPCTARQLEAALHSYCDHHGAWDMRIMSDAISSGRSIQDTRITLALSEGSGESSPSPSSPTSPAPTDADDTSDPRPATEQEIHDGNTQWCAACRARCSNKGKDDYVFCRYFIPIKPQGES